VQFRGRRFAVAMVCAGLAAATAAQGPQLLSVQREDGGLRLQLDQLPARDEGTLALWLDRSDMTALLQPPRGSTELLLPAQALALSPGAARVRLWLVLGSQWQPVGELPLDAAAAPAAASAPAPAASAKRWKPRVDFGLKGQPDGNRHGSVPPAPRWNHHDVTLRAGLQLDDTWGEHTLRGTMQAAGSSYRGEALRYAARQAAATKTDLAEYRVDLAGERSTLAVGHLPVGNHPLLLQRYASRGISGSLEPAAGWQLSLSAINGSAIVGFDNPLGLGDDQHRIVVASVARELDPAQPGAMRLEASTLDAQLRAVPSFNQGQVPDAERLRGLGLRLQGQAGEGRARWDVALARSQYRPADDPQLGSAGASAALVPLRPSAGNAYLVDLAADLWRDAPSAGARWPLVLTLQWRRLHVPPLYKTVGTFLAADQASDRIAAQAQLGALQFALFDERKEDNLDALPNLLKTGTRLQGLSVVVPAQLFAAPEAAGNTAWPSTTVQVVRNRQRALNAPDFAQGGVAATHRPDQANRELRLALAWTLDKLAFGYGWQQAWQDNRQTGRENADFLSGAHQLRASWVASDRLQLAIEGGRSRQYSYERAAATVTRSLSASLAWQVAEGWALQSALAGQHTDDLVQLSRQRLLTWQTQLARAFQWGGGDGVRPRPGQWFVRHAWLQSSQQVPAFGLAARGHQWLVNAGLNLTWEAQ